jgi:hypothetical protein
MTMNSLETSQPSLNLPIPAASHPLQAAHGHKMIAVFVMATVIVFSMGAWVSLLGWQLFRLGRTIFNLF